MKKKYLSAFIMLMGNLIYSQNETKTYKGRVGINTNNPDNTLHIKSESNPLKLEGLQISTESNSILVTTPEGVVKKIGGESLKEVLTIPTNSGATNISGSTLSATNNQHTNIIFGNVTTNIVDTLKGYDSSTGIYTVNEDGLYHLSALIRFVVNVEKSPSHPISVDGRSIRMAVGFTVKGIDKEYRVGYVDRQIIRGLYIPEGTNTTSSNIGNIGLYFFQSNGTVWLKKGEQVTLRYSTYGGIDPITESDRGVKDSDRAFIDLNQSSLKIFRIL